MVLEEAEVEEAVAAVGAEVFEEVGDGVGLDSEGEAFPLKCVFAPLAELLCLTAGECLVST